jgi:hypothetical protein
MHVQHRFVPVLHMADSGDPRPNCIIVCMQPWVSD